MTWPRCQAFCQVVSDDVRDAIQHLSVRTLRLDHLRALMNLLVAFPSLNYVEMDDVHLFGRLVLPPQPARPEFRQACTLAFGCTSLLPLLPWLARNDPPPSFVLDMRGPPPDWLHRDVAGRVTTMAMLCSDAWPAPGYELVLNAFYRLESLTLCVYYGGLTRMDLVRVVHLVARSCLLRTLMHLAFRSRGTQLHQHLSHGPDWAETFEAFFSHPWTHLRSFNVDIMFGEDEWGLDWVPEIDPFKGTSDGIKARQMELMGAACEIRDSSAPLGLGELYQMTGARNGPPVDVPG